ncbi:MAG: hypothetical protein WCK77_24980, partial [Verrucomicrobiota bacterium]
MIYEPFAKLANMLPRSPRQCSYTSVISNDNPFADYGQRRAEYMRPDFGWFAVKRLCAAGVAFPIFPEGKINWLFKALLWKNRPDIYHNHRSIIPLRYALTIHAGESGRSTRAILNAALIARDATIEAVTAALGLPCDGTSRVSEAGFVLRPIST